MGSEVNASTPCSADVENGWICACTPPICLHGQERENFQQQAGLIASNSRSEV